MKKYYFHEFSNTIIYTFRNNKNQITVKPVLATPSYSDFLGYLTLFIPLSFSCAFDLYSWISAKTE